MTVRVYLAAARLTPGPPQPGDLPAERLFVHASDLPEVWVETESGNVPERGRSVSFVLARPMGLGFERVTGTVERKVSKRQSRRTGEPSAASGLEAFAESVQVTNEVRMTRGRSRADLVVVGAGAAGLAAAKTARELGLDVVMFEATDRIGGRAFTDVATLGLPWDLVATGSTPAVSIHLFASPTLKASPTAGTRLLGTPVETTAAVTMATEAVVSILGSRVRGQICATIVSRWGHEPAIRGAYAAAPGQGHRRGELATPLDSRVSFVGEAMSPEFFTTCHGAWESGAAATRQVAQALDRISQPRV